MKTKTILKTIITSCLTFVLCGKTLSQSQCLINSVNTATCSVKSFTYTPYNCYSNTGVCTFDFGDGSALQTIATPTNSNFNIFHVYSNTISQIYTVTINVFMNSTTTIPCSTGTTSVFVGCSNNTVCSSNFISYNHAQICNFVEFYNTSLGNGTIYKMNFGDGNMLTTTGNLGSHSYATNGSYSATLEYFTASDTINPCSSITKTIAVNCGTNTPCPQVNSITQQIGANGTVTLTALSNGVLNTQYVAWQIPNSQLITYSNPCVIQYTANGSYVVAATYSNTVNNNCLQWFYSPVLITNIPNICASPITYTNSTLCNKISFNKILPSGYFSVWTFGDGTTHTTYNSNVWHTYPALPANYNVSVSVYANTVTPCGTNSINVNVGCTSSNTCQANYVAYVNGNPSNCLKACFQSTSVGFIDHYEWDFGDGTVLSTSTGTVCHIYPSNNTYTTSLSIFNLLDSSACSISTKTIAVNCGTNTPCPQVNSITQQIGANGTVTLTALSNGVLNTQYVAWQIPNSQIITYGNPCVIQYTANATYSVCATYSNMCTQYFCSNVIISNSIPCQSSFTVTSSAHTAFFTAANAGPGVLYYWGFGNNSGAFGYSTSMQTFYNNFGTYTVSLEVYTASNTVTPCSSSTQTILISQGSNCQASMTHSLSCNDLILTNNSTGSNNTYLWDFGDGTQSNTSSIYFTHSYPSIGFYIATLNVFANPTDTIPCSIAQYSFAVSCMMSQPCQVNSQFNVFADTANSGYYFAYNNSTGNGNLSYLWDFGDGTTSAQPYPFHQYVIPGNYIICLTTTSQVGSNSCSETYCDSSSVNKMISSYLMSQLNVLAPTSVKENISIIKNISAFPNPISDVLNIDVELTTNVTNLTGTIVDALGKIVSVNELKNSKSTINTSNLDKGFYFLTITVDNGKVLKTIKLVK